MFDWFSGFTVLKFVEVCPPRQEMPEPPDCVPGPVIDSQSASQVGVHPVVD